MTTAPRGGGGAAAAGGGGGGGGGGGEEALRVRGKKRRRLYRSESDPSAPAAAGPLQQVKGHRAGDGRRPFEARPFPAGTRTIGSYHGAVTNSALHQQPPPPPPPRPAPPSSFTVHRDPDTHLVRLAPRQPTHRGVFSSSGPASLQHSYSPAQRGRRRAHSSPVCSPLVVGGESYSLASPSLRLQGGEEGGRAPFSGFHLAPPG